MKEGRDFLECAFVCSMSGIRDISKSVSSVGFTLNHGRSLMVSMKSAVEMIQHQDF